MVMDKRLLAWRSALSILAAAFFSLALLGCGDSGEKAKSGTPATEHPKSEHPKSEHPKGDHPKSSETKPEHPKSEHPKGEHPK